MSHKSIVIGRVFAVRWDDPTVDDVKRIVASLVGARERSPKPMIYLGVVPATSRAPDDAVRKTLSDHIDRLCAPCETVHIILEGSGVKFAAIRSVAAGMFLVSGNRKMHMHDKVDAALAKANLSESERHLVIARCSSERIIG